MAKPTVITTENFHKYLSKTVAMDGTLRNRVQNLVVYGLTQYDEHHNSTPLTEIITADFHGIRTQAVQEYIESHTDLVLTKMEDGSIRFKREAKEGFEFVMPEVTWWEFSKVGQAKPLNADESLKQFTNKLDRAIKGEGKAKLEEGTEEEAAHLLAHLKAYRPLSAEEIAAMRQAQQNDAAAQAQA